jgi:hypothetical protein
MKRVFLLFVLFGLMFVSAVNEPTVEGIGAGDVEAIEDIIEGLPIDPDTGKPDFDEYDISTKADERIAKINEYVGPVTKVLFGVELTLSWIFVFSVLLWLLLIELILMPVSEIFNWNLGFSFLGSGIIATLAMQGFGKDFVAWIDVLVTQWYIAIIVVVVAFIIGFIYSGSMKYLGLKIKMGKEAAAKAQTARDRAVISASAKIEKKRLKGS